jgi:hypothetical protein
VAISGLQQPTEALNLALAQNRLDPQYLINSLSRNLTHGLTKVNLRENLPAGRSRNHIQEL